MTSRRPTEERRVQIADAALKVIAEQGLGRFTTQAIAAEIGVTDGSLFRHFGSKEEIVLAALDRVEERVFEHFPPTDPDPVARLERFFRFRAGLVNEHPIVARLAFSDELPHAAGPRGADKVHRWKQRTLDFLVATLAEARDAGRIRADLPPREVALVVLGTLFALAQLRPHASDPHAVDRAWRVLTTLFLAEEAP